MISKTKKRLSDDSWNLPCITLMTLGLLALASYGFRSLYITWNFGLIDARIPVMHVPLNDPLSKDRPPDTIHVISERTPVIALTHEAFFVGDLDAFTESYAQVRNKIKIPHIKGSPQVGQLISTLKRWTRSREINSNIKPIDFAVLVPAEQWPVAVVMQIIQHLKNSGLYNHIILGAELI